MDCERFGSTEDDRRVIFSSGRGDFRTHRERILCLLWRTEPKCYIGMGRFGIAKLHPQQVHKLDINAFRHAIQPVK